MALVDLAQAAADAVREHGWEATPAHDAVLAFQKAWNVDQQSQSPPDPVTEDGKDGPQTTSAMQAAGAQNVPPAYFTPGTVAPKGSSSGAGVLPAPAQPSALDMQPAAFDAFFALSPRFEGYTAYMYTDSKGKVTSGVGNLIDSVAAAQALDWRKPDGSKASPDEVAAAWQAVKGAYPGVQSTASASLTDLRLSKDAISALVLSHLRSDVAILRGEFPSYDKDPAAAQLALEFISWAWGAGFPSVWNRLGKGALGDQFKAAIASGDFTGAAGIVKDASAHEESINRGIVPRDLAVEALLLEAAAVKKLGIDPARLFYPSAVPAAKAAVAGAGLAGLFLFAFGLGAWALTRGHS